VKLLVDFEVLKMVAVVNGADSTLKTDQLEPRVLEGFFLLEEKETAQGINRTTINTNFNANTASVNFSLDVTPVVDANGNVIHTVVNYLNNDEFVAGVDSTIKGDSLQQNIFEMLGLVSIYERDATKNPNNVRNLAATYNYATGVFSGTMTFQLTVERDGNGIIKIKGKEYLV
jgi:hypothetical protein